VSEEPPVPPEETGYEEPTYDEPPSPSKVESDFPQFDINVSTRKMGNIYSSYDEINVDLEPLEEAAPESQGEDDELMTLFDHILSIPSAQGSDSTLTPPPVEAEEDEDFDDIMNVLSQLGK